jgi:peptidoglycan hydrolase-like protein with peptidoglycan-binding domain
MAYIDKNDSEITVRELQEMLRRYGMYSGSSALVIPVNGIYGRETETAVAFFQRSVGLAPTGKADLDTWIAIKASYDEASRTFHGIVPIPRDTKAIFPGERSDAVTMLQLMLNDLARYYGEYCNVALTGIYDDPTALAVDEIRRKNGIPSIDYLDIQGWNMIVDEYNSAVNSNE